MREYAIGRPLKIISIIFFALNISNLCANELDESIVGLWQVAEVHLNTNSSRTTLYQWNDPRLRGRFFKFESNGISNDTPENGICRRPKVNADRLAPKQLIAESMAGYGYPTKLANPKDYKLNLNELKLHKVLHINCGEETWNGTLGANGGPRGSWIVKLERNVILLRWYDETILVLRKVRENTRPNPSFLCARKSSKAESAICHSLALASFDRSIYDAYRLAITQHRESEGDENNLINEQRAWLKARTECESDEKCLKSSMSRRLEELMEGTRQ
ncbi:lysozyme inhibitor LprI family protein [Cupriavidus necator]|uniref:lysozyme inhibitor LprI family protein n=1 Tax=Cupriavidus necator TaxID=106590 RepID=UPI00339DA6D6